MALPTAIYFSIMCYQPQNLARLSAHFEIMEFETPDDVPDEVLSTVELCFAPLGYLFDDAKMARCPNLRAIATNTTGVPHIDMAAAAERGIEVFSLKDEQAFLATITPTAEHTWGLLLALTRHIREASASVLKGEWNRRPYGGRAMLSRLCLGVIGYGRLGRIVAGYGVAFGMEVVCYDTENIEAAVGVKKISSIEDLVSMSDVISLHVPANAQTHGFIDQDIISNFKSGALLINTARGELIDEMALLNALVSGHIAGAALDVLNGEFDPDFKVGDHALVNYARENDNLIITPHIGGSTYDAWQETEARVINAAINLFEGARK